MQKKTAIFNYIGEITLTSEVYNACSHSGQCDDDVKRCRQLPEVVAELSKINPEQLRKELKEYGAWDDTELQNHEENLNRILWIAAGNIQDGQYYTKLDGYLDFEECKRLIDQAKEDGEAMVILCQHYSINVASKYEDGEELQYDLDDFSDRLGHFLEVNSYDDLVVDFTTDED